MKKSQERIEIRMYPESVYPVEKWVWAFNIEGQVPVWHNGGSSKDDTIHIVNEQIGIENWTPVVENGRLTA